MNNKVLLFAGIFLLTVGILLRIFTDYSSFAIILIGLGGFSKVTYLILRVKQGNYKPGYEIVLLIIGLIVFFTGIYLRNQSNAINPWLFMGPGILLKVGFVVLFVQKLKAKK